MPAQRKHFAWAIAAVAACTIVLLAWWGWRIVSRSELGIGVLGSAGVIPTRTLISNLHSDNADTLRESLGVLYDRNDPAAVPAVLPLLNHPDDYVWLNAALYLGQQRRQEAVPYLIKALRHTAFRSVPDEVAELQSITGQKYGADFSVWHDWWMRNHPNSDFDFEHGLGPMPRVQQAIASQPS